MNRARLAHMTVASAQRQPSRLPQLAIEPTDATFLARCSQR